MEFGGMKISRIILAVCVILSINACTRASVRVFGESSARPVWVQNTHDFWQENGFLYYKTVIETDTNLENAKRMAVSRGRVALAEQIRTRIKNQFLLITESSNLDTQHTIKDVFYEKVDGLILMGTHIEDSYYQKIWVKNSKQDKMFYRYYLLLKVSEADYNNAVQEAFSETIQDLPQYKKDLSNIYKQFNND